MKAFAFILVGMGAMVGGMIFGKGWLPESFLGFAGVCALVGSVLGFALGWFLCALFGAVRTGSGPMVMEGGGRRADIENRWMPSVPSTRRKGARA